MFGNFIQRKPGQTRTSLILGRAGATIVQPIKGSTVKNDEGGEHVIEAQSHFWLRKPIPAGWLVVHTITDPEPMTLREPKGYGPHAVEMLVGPYLPRAWGAGQNVPRGIPKWVWYAVAGVVGLLTIGVVVGIIFWKKYQQKAAAADAADAADHAAVLALHHLPTLLQALGLG